jgi:hypothetical protein
MKAILMCIAGSVAGLSLSNQATAQDATTKVSVDVLALPCNKVLEATRAQAHKPQFARHDPLKIRAGYEIQLLSFHADDEVTTKVVGIIGNATPQGPETAHFSTICVNDKIQLPTTENGDIVITANQGESVPIIFHLNQTPDDPEVLKYHRWKHSGKKSLAMSGPFAKGKPTHKPKLGEHPHCLDLSKVVPKDANLSFDFADCGAQGADQTFVYLLLAARKRPHESEKTVPIDPQIINHPH